jgi:4-aminobutyrate aminotransferase / (S)-3-amino-2-methylpropionate transaminase / 5-aminovalerate transaminase
MAGFNFKHTPKNVPLIDTKYRRISTKIPTQESVEMLEKAYKLESRSMHGQMPVVWDRADNFQIYDAYGNCWIDFTSTIFVANAGHGNPKIVDAVRNVIDKPLLHTYTYLSQERLEYLEMLIEKTPKQFEKVFMLSAGTEATECALKLMREHGIKKGKNRGGIVCIEGNWHGRTLGAQMMGWNPEQKAWVGYHDPNIFHIPFPYPWDSYATEDPKQFFKDGIEKLCENQGLNPKKDLCGFMLETFQGWGAVFYPPEFVQAISEFSKEHDILVTFDEMQSGFGRTGELFGYMHYDVEPDLLCCGKGASSGFPLALVLGSAEVLDLPGIGSMSSTHSANPVVCAAGKANLQCLFEDGLIENSKKLGIIFHQELDKIKYKFNEYLYWVEGKGLLAALIFKDKNGNTLPSLCDSIAELCMQRGLLVVHTGRESIKLAPPLTITEEAMLEGLSVLEECIADSINKNKI